MAKMMADLAIELFNSTTPLLGQTVEPPTGIRRFENTIQIRLLIRLYKDEES